MSNKRLSYIKLNQSSYISKSFFELNQSSFNSSIPSTSRPSQYHSPLYSSKTFLLLFILMYEKFPDTPIKHPKSCMGRVTCLGVGSLENGSEAIIRAGVGVLGTSAVQSPLPTITTGFFLKGIIILNPRFSCL